jgi:putative oxidoreductase
VGFKREALRDAGLLWLRLMMGACIATHGYGKLFGGHFSEFTEGVGKLHLPGFSADQWALLAAWSEFAGGIFLMMGLATRVAAFLIFSTMTVAVFRVHWSDAFDVKELALAYWTMAAALALTGPGRFSIDAALLSHFGRGAGGGGKAQ